MFDALRRWFKREFNSESEAAADYVIVAKGDSLWRIAQEGVGDGSRWTELVDANPDKKWSASNTVIHPGDKVKLPESWL